MLNVTGKHAQFCNSNDANQLRKSNPRTRDKKIESYKKSFQDAKVGGALRMKDARSHKTKKYTQSYDSNQLNFKFKRRKRAEQKGQLQKTSPKKIRVMHEGRKR